MSAPARRAALPGYAGRPPQTLRIPPLRPCPMPSPFRQRCSLPDKHLSQRPQALVSSDTTRSPGLMRSTSAPTSSTTPANSCPSTTPGLTPRRSTPDITSRSWWQNPQAATRTSASPGPGCGTGRSTTESRGGTPVLSNIRARIARHCMLTPMHRQWPIPYNRRVFY